MGNSEAEVLDLHGAVSSHIEGEPDFPIAPLADAPDHFGIGKGKRRAWNDQRKGAQANDHFNGFRASKLFVPSLSNHSGQPIPLAWISAD